MVAAQPPALLQTIRRYDGLRMGGGPRPPSQFIYTYVNACSKQSSLTSHSSCDFIFVTSALDKGACSHIATRRLAWGCSQKHPSLPLPATFPFCHPFISVRNRCCPNAGLSADEHVRMPPLGRTCGQQRILRAHRIMDEERAG